MTSFTFLCYVFFPLLLLVTTLVVLRRNRGMKSKEVCPWCGKEDCPFLTLFILPQKEKLAKRNKTYTPSFLQEKDNPTEERN